MQTIRPGRKVALRLHADVPDSFWLRTQCIYDSSRTNGGFFFSAHHFPTWRLCIRAIYHSSRTNGGLFCYVTKFPTWRLYILAVHYSSWTNSVACTSLSAPKYRDIWYPLWIEKCLVRPAWIARRYIRPGWIACCKLDSEFLRRELYIPTWIYYVHFSSETETNTPFLVGYPVYYRYFVFTRNWVGHFGTIRYHIGWAAVQTFNFSECIYTIRKPFSPTL